MKNYRLSYPASFMSYAEKRRNFGPDFTELQSINKQSVGCLGWTHVICMSRDPVHVSDLTINRENSHLTAEATNKMAAKIAG